jgi:HlyD family secretion protein/epimerase transport system membrane fusion protein
MFRIEYDETGESTRIVKSGMYFLVFFVMGFLAWAFLAPISGAVVAEGVTKVDTKRKTIQHLEGGVVKNILVHEGDYVSEGQVLLVIEDAEVKSNLTILIDQLSSANAKAARLMAEKTFATSVKYPVDLLESKDPKVNEIIKNENAVFYAAKKSLDDEISVVRQEISDAKKQELSIKEQINASREAMKYKQERVNAGEALSARQFLEKNQFLQLKEEMSAAQQDLAGLESSLSSLRQQQSELELRIIGRRNEYAKNADNELKETNKQIFEFKEKINPAAISLNRFQVKAPISGQVIDLKVTTLGGVVRPGDDLMDIVPKQHELILEVKIPNKDIAKVYVGQKADIQLLAYNSRSVPHINGHVIYVSDDALEYPNNPGQFYYLSHIRVDEGELANVPEVHLAPGMPITAFIQTKARTFVDMLIKPFESSVSRGLRREAI